MSRGHKPVPGEKHNMLTYVEDAGRQPCGQFGGRTIYATLGKWRCDCGKEIVCRNRHVVAGAKKSCGCLLRAKGEAWRRGKRVPAARQPASDRNALRFLVTVKLLSPDDTVTCRDTGNYGMLGDAMAAFAKAMAASTGPAPEKGEETCQTTTS